MIELEVLKQGQRYLINFDEVAHTVPSAQQSEGERVSPPDQETIFARFLVLDGIIDGKQQNLKLELWRYIGENPNFWSNATIYIENQLYISFAVPGRGENGSEAFWEWIDRSN